MELALTLACGLSAAITASSLARAVRLRAARPGTWPWTVTILWGCVLAACLTALGVIGILPGVLVSVVLTVTAFTALRRSRSAGAQIGAGPAHLWHDAVFLAAFLSPRGLLQHLASRRDDDDTDDGPAPWRHRMRQSAAAGPGRQERDGKIPRLRQDPASPGDAAGGVRTVPRLREDPALGPVPAPQEVITGIAVPPPWAELAGWIAGFVAETDNEQSAFLHGAAAGLVAIAQAFGTLSETAVNEIGLDPAYGAALLEAADAIAQTSGEVALADQRYLTIYAAVKEFVDGGGILPFRTREFLGGGGADGTAAA